METNTAVIPKVPQQLDRAGQTGPPLPPPVQKTLTQLLRSLPSRHPCPLMNARTAAWDAGALTGISAPRPNAYPLVHVN